VSKNEATGDLPERTEKNRSHYTTASLKERGNKTRGKKMLNSSLIQGERKTRIGEKHAACRERQRKEKTKRGRQSE